MNIMPLPVTKYGPPSDIQIQPLYGAGPFRPIGSPLQQELTGLIGTITNPLMVSFCFIVGVPLYLLTHKRVFIIIPLILSVLYLARYFAETVFGVYFSHY
jgi:hypothetical protein